MIAIGDAQHQILEKIPILGKEQVHILASLRRVLAQDVVAARDVPSSENSPVDDGYCCRHDDIEGTNSANPKKLKLIGESTAGHLLRGRVGKGEAVSVMTGDLIASGTDTVIMLEDTRQDGEMISCLKDPGQGGHIRRCGEDVLAGEMVLSRGDILRPSAIGMLTTLGHAYLVERSRNVFT